MTNLSLDDQLRVRRNEIWSRYASAARDNSLPPDQICHEWSVATDSLLQSAFEHCFHGQKTALFALGKLGSRELNLSSDVDLLIITEEATPCALSGLRRFQKLLADRTALGFVFRVDFDLRPGGRQGPLTPNLEQFRDYYGNYGETWERLAFVRLRAVAGDQALQSEVLAFAHKFSFRKHLDFTLLEDLKTLRSKIHDHYRRRTQDQVIDLKLGLGGIRDVELFTHALQVIHGGRDEALRIGDTTMALKLLCERKCLPEKESTFLRNHYWNLRRLENYVQALNDEQTHLLRLNEPHPEFVTDAISHLLRDMHQCDTIVKTLLGEAPQEHSTEDVLKNSGLNDEDLSGLWQEILGREVLSRNKGRDELARRAFLTEFLETLQEQKGDLRKGLLHLKDFISNTRAKASFFSLLLREKDLLKRLAWLFGHSPYLSRILCNRPELLDSFVYRSQDRHSEDLGALLEELAEKKLLSEIINGSEFLEDRNLRRLLENLTSTADEVALTLLQTLNQDFSSSLRILALGKWGGREMGFRSDLDFIFVLDDEPHEKDFKLARRFITRMTESHRGGNIYSIDMRLRPTGKAGPLIIRERDLQEYLQTEAAAWERQAYLKARWIGSPQSSPRDFISRGLTHEELEELNRIRQQLLNPGPELNLKFNEGGLVDLELAAQTRLLQTQQVPRSSKTEDFFFVFGHNEPQIRQNYDRLRQIEQMLQLIASESSADLRPNHESFQALTLALHLPPESLLQEVLQLFADNVALLKELDPRRLPH